MSLKIGFIGYGNMGQAIADGLVRSGKALPQNILVTDVDEEKKAVATKMGFVTTSSSRQIAKKADVLMLAVKPNQCATVIADLQEAISEATIVVSIAAGVKIATLEGYFAKPVKVVRTMPNTPVMVQAGMTAVVPNERLNSADIRLVSELFLAIGRVEVVDEALIDAVIVTSGSAPAYVYMLIEAMINGGIAEGMPREMATRFAAQAVYGAAKMVMQTESAPNDLREAVCSPGGTTIEAVKYLNDNQFGNIVQGAMKACAKRSKEMS